LEQFRGVKIVNKNEKYEYFATLTPFKNTQSPFGKKNVLLDDVKPGPSNRNIGILAVSASGRIPIAPQIFTV
jgi:hypothetical protein